MVRIMKPTPQKPTASELEILRILWSRGPSTVREVYESLSETKDLGYTTVEALQIIATKARFAVTKPSVRTLATKQALRRRNRPNANWLATFCRKFSKGLPAN